MRFFSRRFLEEFLLYSSHFVVFFILMLVTTPGIVTLQPISIAALLILLGIQTALLASNGHLALPRFLFSFITPAGYTALTAFARSGEPLDMANFFLWTTSFYVGALQAMTILARRSWIKRSLEVFLTVGTVTTFVFFYFYLDLRIVSAAALRSGAISGSAYLESFSLANFAPAFMAFARSPQHLFFMFGAVTYGLISLGERIKEISLRDRLDRALDSLEPPTAPSPSPARAETRAVTVLYADIWNFSPLADKAGPEAAIMVLERWYSMWNLVASRHGGHVDQFVGDSAILVFGLIGEGDAAERAVACALDFLDELPHFQEDLASKSLPVVKHVGIGIHSGQAAVGELATGGLRRLATVGEAVNAAARLDSLCREYKQDLILSASAYRLLGLDSQAWFQPLGEVLFRGKTQPVAVYGRK